RICVGLPRNEGNKMNADHTCRSCGSKSLYSFLDLGITPLADGLVKLEDLDKEDQRFPLEVAFCEDCALVQILETVSPETVFGNDYPYYSSFSTYLLRHSKEN